MGSYSKGEVLFAIITWTVLIGLVLGFFWFVASIRWQWTNDVVSGIVYDTQNDGLISGNTTFKVRASENMAVTEDTSPTYCLPPNSQYIALVNEAAADKTVKVVVKTNKTGFSVMTPWACQPNVTVEKVAQ